MHKAEQVVERELLKSDEYEIAVEKRSRAKKKGRQGCSGARRGSLSKKKTEDRCLRALITFVLNSRWIKSLQGSSSCRVLARRLTSGTDELLKVFIKTCHLLS